MKPIATAFLGLAFAVLGSTPTPAQHPSTWISRFWEWAGLRGLGAGAVVGRPSSTSILWSHDVHISRGEHEDDQYDYHFGVSLGSHLAEAYGSDYKGIRTFNLRRDLLGVHGLQLCKTDALPLYSAPVGSLDHAFHQVADQLQASVLLLDLSDARGLPWLSRPLPTRFANHVNVEYGYWTQFSLPYQFDGIFFVDSTTSANSYSRN